MNTTDKIKQMLAMRPTFFQSPVSNSIGPSVGPKLIIEPSLNPKEVWFTGPREFVDNVNNLLIYHDEKYETEIKAFDHCFFQYLILTVTDNNQIKMSCGDRFVILPIEAIEPWAFDLQDEQNESLSNLGDEIIDLIDEIILEEWVDVNK